jgi:hypothetical protein
MAHAKDLLKLEPSENDKRACQEALDELSALADEMRTYLDRIAPVKKP